MQKNRLEAFSDGVLAIIITVMVFKIEAPKDGSFASLSTLITPVASFVLSFLYLGIYWNNHHHLLQLTQRVNGLVLWANLHLLFWLSLLPFATHWLNQAGVLPTTAGTYGTVLLGAGIAYRLLCAAILRLEPKDSILARAIGRDRKGYLSLVLYAMALGLAVIEPYASMALYLLVAMLWIVPDRRIEHACCEAAKTAVTTDVEESPRAH